MKLLEFPEYSKVAQMMWDRGLVPMSAKYLELAAGQQQPGAGVGAASARRPRHRRRLRGAGGDNDRALQVGGAQEHAASNASSHRNEGRSNNIRYPGNSTNLYNAPTGVSIDYATRGGALRQIPYNGTIFLTTEDPQVIQQANKWGEQNHWTIVYTNLFDRCVA